MEYIYFRSSKGNFGDNLNPWLWDQLLGNELKDKDGYFLGIGSILHNGNQDLKKLDAAKPKIVFGTGVRPAHDYKKFRFDKSWDIRFLRGPLSAQSLGNRFSFISDAAYAIRLIPNFKKEYLNVPKKYDVSLMPYFHSVGYFNWEKICDELGYHYISPFSENGVEFTLQELAASKMVITEAMHGAILSDALRVPWSRFILSTPFTEGAMVSEFKWEDWIKSIGMNNPEVIYLPFYKKGKISSLFRILSNQSLSVDVLNKRKTQELILDSLALPVQTFLSADKTLKSVDERLREELRKLHVNSRL